MSRQGSPLNTTRHKSIKVTKRGKCQILADLYKGMFKMRCSLLIVLSSRKVEIFPDYFDAAVRFRTDYGEYKLFTVNEMNQKPNGNFVPNSKSNYYTCLYEVVA